MYSVHLLLQTTTIWDTSLRYLPACLPGQMKRKQCIHLKDHPTTTSPTDLRPSLPPSYSSSSASSPSSPRGYMGNTPILDIS